ncbi:MAG TPA: polysaccharide biosynthesis tyrosine autokinase [Bryobacteraceae bacterium]
MEQLPAPDHQALGSVPERIPRPGYARGYPANAYYAGYPDPMQEDLQETESGTLVEYWRIVKRRRGTLILAIFLGLLAAFLYTLPQTPIYRARAAVEIQNINSEFLNAKRLNPVSEDWTGADALTDVQTQMRIIQSESLADQTIDHFKDAGKLGPLQTKPSPLLERVKSILRLPTADAAGVDYRIRQRALKALTVREVGETRMVEIMFDSENAAFASDFVDALVSNYIESNIQARWQMSERTGQWLSRQLDDMRVKLERSEDALQGYARKAGLLYTAPSGGSEKTNVSEEKLRQLQEELSRAQADRAAAQSRYDIAKSAAPDTVADVLNDPSLRELQTKLTDLRRQQAELITVYTPKHEKVRRVAAQIAPLDAAFNKARAAILERIHNDYQAALGRESLLQADYAAQSKVVTDQAEKSIQYNILKREVDSNRQLYESMLQQVKEASIASAIRASNIRVVDPAKVPYKPYSPDYWLNCGLGLFSGLVLGIAFVVMRERADRTLQEPGDAEFWTRVPELGVIPSATGGIARRLYYARSKPLPAPEESADPERAAAAKALAVGGRNGNGSQTVELMTWSNRPSMVAEAFRTVLTSIMFSGENGTRPRLLVLTSANPMEGKTTVVSNLGIALAEIRQNVLIIDADLRKPRLHEVFNLPNERGLSNFLQSQSLADGDLQEALRTTIHRTAIPGLSVLTSGPSTSAAANLLHSPVLAEMFSAFKKEYDMVLVDTPPMLQMTDARVAGRLADGVIFVARAGRTTRDAAVAAHQRLADDRIRVLGTILNDWDPRKSPSGYYGYHAGLYYGGKKYGAYYGS